MNIHSQKHRLYITEIEDDYWLQINYTLGLKVMTDREAKDNNILKRFTSKQNKQSQSQSSAEFMQESVNDLGKEQWLRDILQLFHTAYGPMRQLERQDSNWFKEILQQFFQELLQDSNKSNLKNSFEYLEYLPIGKREYLKVSALINQLQQAISNDKVEYLLIHNHKLIWSEFKQPQDSRALLLYFNSPLCLTTNSKTANDVTIRTLYLHSQPLTAFSLSVSNILSILVTFSMVIVT